jgi:hypothetical protein
MEWIANFASAPALILNPDAPVLEAQMRVGQQVSLLLVPRGASNVCPPPATWFSTNPSAASFEANNPGAGAVEKPFGNAVLHGIGTGDTQVYVVVYGRRFDIVYNAAGNNRIGVVHVVP